jgi:hypothetical protein
VREGKGVKVCNQYITESGRTVHPFSSPVAYTSCPSSPIIVAVPAVAFSSPYTISPPSAYVPPTAVTHGEDAGQVGSNFLHPNTPGAGGVGGVMSGETRSRRVLDAF